MANSNYDPNARFDTGPNAAGTGRITSPPPTTNTGQAADTSRVNSDIRYGFSCAGAAKNNVGPNVAGAPRSINGT